MSNESRWEAVKFYLLERTIAATPYTNTRREYKQPSGQDLIEAAIHAAKLYGPWEKE